MNISFLDNIKEGFFELIDKLHMKVCPNWTLKHFLELGKWTCIIGFIISCIIIIGLVLLQRGEEGAFSKNRGDKITTDNNTLIRATVIASISMFGLAMILNGIIYYNKHLNSKSQQINKVEEKKETPKPEIKTENDSIKK